MTEERSDQTQPKDEANPTQLEDWVAYVVVLVVMSVLFLIITGLYEGR